MSRIAKLGVCVLVLSVGVVLASPTPVQAGGKDYCYDSWLNPRDPYVGETYYLNVRLTNKSDRYIRFRVAVTGLPAGDQMISSSVQTVVVGPGGAYTVPFSIYCGVRGGTVNYDVQGSWAD